MNDIDTITQMLVVILGVMVAVLVILTLIFIVLKIKEKKKNKSPYNDEKKLEKKENTNKNTKKSYSKEYTKESIMNFMEFEKIEDNMIVQKKGKRFLMAIECQGVNYDLMSNVEKVAVEEGFQQFLNTLTHQIQIYIQTRSVNLEESIRRYQKRVKEIEDNYRRMQFQYNSAMQANTYNTEQKNQMEYEMTKQKNLLEYATDLLNDTKQMSLNRNILNKKYFIIVPYYFEENNGEKYDYEEIKNIAFSELYTKSQSIIRTLSACSINGKILNSNELVDLLYVAYNRDEAEVFGIDKAIKAGYTELYSTAPDVFEKKIQALDEQIRENAINKANEAIQKVKSRQQQLAEEKEDSFEDAIEKMAEMILSENREYVGNEIAEEAIKELKKQIKAQDKENGKGGKNNEEKKEKARTRNGNSTKQQ